MWNRHPVVRQEKLHKEAKARRRDGILKDAVNGGQTFWGTRQDVKKVTGELPVTGEDLEDE